jgi:hypothetical protein
MFDGFDNSRYEDEVRSRWGDTEAYTQSAQRTASYGDAEWELIRSQAEEINLSFVELQAAGEPPDGAAARAVAERHRQHISRWFYDCSPEFHRVLAAMYVTDPRFHENYERHAEGLAQYVHDAIVANMTAASR